MSLPLSPVYSWDKSPLLGKSKSLPTLHLSWGLKPGWRSTWHHAESSHFKTNNLAHFPCPFTPRTPQRVLCSQTSNTPLSAGDPASYRSKKTEAVRTPRVPTTVSVSLFAAVSRCTVWPVSMDELSVLLPEIRPFTGAYLDSIPLTYSKVSVPATPYTHIYFPLLGQCHTIQIGS